MPDSSRHFLIENSLVEPVRLRRPANVDAIFNEWDSQLPSGAPIVAYAGTFESYQGLDLLIEAFRRTRAELGSGLLLLIGGRPAQIDFYRRLARENGVEDHCLFTGSLPREAARALLRKAAVVTSPRKRGTQTPLKIYEILASGQPLVATRTAAHTQLLDDSVCTLCEPDTGPLAAALTDALIDRERVARLAANARSLYDERYSKRAYLEKMRRLMERTY